MIALVIALLVTAFVLEASRVESIVAASNSAITNAITPLQNADIPSARPLGGGNYQLNVDGDTNTWTAITCLLYTSPSPRDRQKSRMPSSA